MASSGDQRAWVARVLGYELPPALDTKRLQAAVAAYHDALADIGNGVAALQAKLRATGEPLMTRIADEGLKDLTGGFRVTMSAALMDLVKAPADERRRNAKAVHKLCGKIAGVVSGNQVFSLIDSNPFGVHLNARNGLLQALRTLDAEITASVV
jgi:hypothetical protein